MTPINPFLPHLSEEDVTRLEEAVEQFEAAWCRGERPDPIEFLPADGPRFPTLIELVAIDREFQAADGAARVGRFKLVHEVGAGAFGRVYRGFDPELGREVAVKVPHPGAMSPVDRERAAREARCSARLRHPHIVALYEVVEKDGLPVLVSEFVDGEALSVWSGGGPVAPAKAAAVVAVLADALHHAHSQGVVHRDVKPSNVLIDRDGNPRLLDFGLAWLDEADTLTGDGDLLGTPAYMAPEVVEGAAADARADLYSLGVVLYELLTGERPFRGTTRAVLAQIVAEEPTPPRQLVPDLPRDLETVCLKAMDREPGSRYPTAAALAADLRRWLQGEPVIARPVGIVGRTWRWCRRRPVPAALAGALAAAVVLGIAGVAWEWQRADDRRREAEQYAAEAERERDRTEQQFRVIHRAVIELGGTGNPDWGSGKPSFKLIDPVAQSSAREVQPYYRFLVKQRPDDRELLTRAAYVEQLVGYASQKAGDYDRSAACYEQSLRYLARLRQMNPDDREYVWGEIGAYLGLALAHEFADRPAEALDPAVRACGQLVELINARPDLQSRFRTSIQSSCRRIRNALEAMSGAGGAVRRLRAEGWLDVPEGSLGAGDRVRVRSFLDQSISLGKRCLRREDQEGATIALDSARRMSAAVSEKSPASGTPSLRR
jgi:hypothetical protein